MEEQLLVGTKKVTPQTNGIPSPTDIPPRLVGEMLNGQQIRTRDESGTIRETVATGVSHTVSGDERGKAVRGLVLRVALIGEPPSLGGNSPLLPHDLARFVIRLDSLSADNPDWELRLGEYDVVVVSTVQRSDSLLGSNCNLLNGDLMPRCLDGSRAVLMLADSLSAELWHLIENHDRVTLCDARCAEALAMALWSTHFQACRRERLHSRVEALEQKLEQTKLIGQAKSILAAHLNVSEAAALSRLRAQARRTRRSMHELAKIVVEVHPFLPEHNSIPAGSTTGRTAS